MALRPDGTTMVACAFAVYRAPNVEQSVFLATRPDNGMACRVDLETTAIAFPDDRRLHH